jgi:hypothetical protein
VRKLEKKDIGTKKRNQYIINQHYKYKGKTNYKTIQVRQHKPRKRGVKPVPPKGSEQMKII